MNGASFVRRSSDVWVSECNYVESNFFCGNVVIFQCGSLDETMLNPHVFGACVVSAFFVSCHVCIYVVYVENVRILSFHGDDIYVFVFTNNLFVCRLNFMATWI